MTSKLNKLTLTINRPRLSPADVQELEQAQRSNHAGEYLLTAHLGHSRYEGTMISDHPPEPRERERPVRTLGPRSICAEVAMLPTVAAGREAKYQYKTAATIPLGIGHNFENTYEGGGFDNACSYTP